MITTSSRYRSLVQNFIEVLCDQGIYLVYTQRRVVAAGASAKEEGREKNGNEKKHTCIVDYIDIVTTCHPKKVLV